jgi:hypothetical protein
MGHGMNTEITQIRHPNGEYMEAGMWLLDPVLLANDDASISITRHLTTGALSCTMEFPGLTHTAYYDNSALLWRFITLADPFFPLSYCADTGTLRATFKSPFYSTPSMYCGKPQIRPYEIWRRASLVCDWIANAASWAETLTRPNNTDSQNQLIWTDAFMERYIEHRTTYALSLSSSD